MKLVKKGREGSRWERRHDEPQPACQRLLAHGELPAKARRQLRDRYEARDPFVLAAQVERRLKPILGGGVPRMRSGLPAATLGGNVSAIDPSLRCHFPIRQRGTAGLPGWRTT